MEPNGIHLNQQGYRWFAGEVLRQLQTPDEASTLVITKLPQNKSPESSREIALPLAPTVLPSVITNERNVEVTVENLEPGTYQLAVDGKPCKAASANQWQKKLSLEATPWTEQGDELRRLVRRKNELYFQRYRPQNITYLLGFRSYEQGQNAREIEQLDPLIADLEKKIDEWRKPKRHECTWTRIVEGGK